jgi:hypothetical protein
VEAVTQIYNPIVRTFGRLRAELVEGLDVPRQAIRPGTPLEALIPLEQRRQVWDALRKSGFDMPGLQLPGGVSKASTLAVLATTASFALLLREWTALLSGISFGRIAYTLTRPWSTCIPLGLVTVGDLALFLTCYREHKDSGYRWTRNEISAKVRQIVAESLGHRLDEVHEGSTLAELGAYC